MKTNRGKLWVIDGADGVGKATQVELLIKHLNSSDLLKGKRAHHIAFPHYLEKPWGVLIRQYLDGKLGQLGEVNPYMASLMYAADRANHADEINQMLEAGDWVVCDRYICSNAAFQAAKIDDVKAKSEYLDWLFSTEYELFGVVKPDNVIILTLPTEISTKRTEMRRAEGIESGQRLNAKVSYTDIHEQNVSFMTKVAREYLRLSEQFGWEVINCADGNRELSREEVAQKVWNVVKKSNLVM